MHITKRPSFQAIGRLLLGLATVLALAEPAVAGRKPFYQKVQEAIQNQSSYRVPAAGTIEVAFSPNEGAENLVLKVIDTAEGELKMLCYSFTSAPVVEALIRAQRRGVKVAIVADEKNNTVEDRSGKARAALSAMVNAGADVRLIGVYSISHDKVIVASGRHVELGSFNYSDAAAHRNSENVLVNWGNPELAKVYLGHFKRNYDQSVPYAPRY